VPAGWGEPVRPAAHLSKFGTTPHLGGSTRPDLATGKGGNLLTEEG